MRGLGPQLFPGWEDSTRPPSGFCFRFISRNAGPDALGVSPSGEPTDKFKHQVSK